MVPAGHLPVALQDCHQPDYALAGLSTFRSGGTGKAVFFPRNINQLCDVYRHYIGQGITPILLGHGSNSLLPDGIWTQPLIVTRHLGAIEIKGHVLNAQCGAALANMARSAAKAGLAGLAFAIDIPGACGGSVMGNAGAYGCAMFDVLSELALLLPSGEYKSVPALHYKAGYRFSGIEAGAVVLSAKFSLQVSTREAVESTMAAHQAHRRSAQPQIKGAAGSIFKNPLDDGRAAWELVQACGLQGICVGQAQVSEKHANWVVNQGAASSDDIYQLVMLVREKVEAQTGIRLEPEIKFL